MKILLTGLPKSGKTTLLTHLLENIQLKRGVIAKEVVEKEVRIGFNLLDEQGRTAPLARINQPSNYPVGRFFVDTDSLDEFATRLLDFSSNELLFIDEIGQMQLYSEKFKELVSLYLGSGNDYLGTISAVFEHPFINEVKSRSDVLLCTVTPENRQDLGAVLSTALANRQLYNEMSSRQKDAVLELARHYLEGVQYISLKKLFYNALRYVSEQRVVKDGTNLYMVNGDHDRHSVHFYKEYQCDCDFFNGRQQFKGRAGECSHIQAVKII